MHGEVDLCIALAGRMRIEVNIHLYSSTENTCSLDYLALAQAFLHEWL